MSRNTKLIEEIISHACLRFGFVEGSTLDRIVQRRKREILDEMLNDDYWLVDGKNDQLSNNKITQILEDLHDLLKYIIANESSLHDLVFLKNHNNENAVNVVWPYRGCYFVNESSESINREYFLNPHLKEVWEEGYDQYFRSEHQLMDKMVKKLFESILGLVVSIENIQIACLEKEKEIKQIDYCLTLDHVPQEIYLKILENKEQISEWKELYKISDQIDEEFLTNHQSMMLNTQYFSDSLTGKLLSKIKDIDENIDGLIIYGDNYDGLRFLEKNYKRRIKCTYIDPPYNRGKNEFQYKDKFEHSSWLCMMESLLKEHKKICTDGSIVFISLDDTERPYLESFIGSYFNRDPRFGPILVQTNIGGRDYLPIAKQHEYLLCFYKGENLPDIHLLPRDESEFKYKDPKGRWLKRELRNRNPRFNRKNRPNLFYPFYVNPDSADENGFCTVSLDKTDLHYIEVFPRDSKARDDCWRWGKEKVETNLDINDTRTSNVVAQQRNDGGWNIYEKYRNKGRKAKSIWLDKEFRTENGTIQLRNLFGQPVMDFPKPVELIEQCIRLGSETNDVILDYFAGSGTTAHAVINLNRKDGGNRKYILIEKEDYVQTILIPRIKKVVFSPEWKKGLPKEAISYSHVFKYIEIESYCDSLGKIPFNSINKTAENT
ncbi:MAG: site-specific DNA-methyltransferase [Candidatus Hodarchaeales archaeon]